MKALSKLLLKYMFAGEGLFFVFFFPLMIMLIMGELFTNVPSGAGITQQQYIDSGARHFAAKSFINGISVTSIISTALFLIPITIVEFKNSVIMKRIGATNVKPYHFMIIVLGMFLVQSLFAFIYNRLIGTLIFGWREGIKWNVGFDTDFFGALPWVVFTALVAMLIGLSLAAISKNARQANIIINIIYFPISILSGGFSPIENVRNSSLLKGINYINPFRYTLEPYYKSLGSNIDLSATDYVIYIIVATVIIAGLSLFVKKKLKWTS